MTDLLAFASAHPVLAFLMFAWACSTIRIVFRGWPKRDEVDDE